MGVKNIHSQCTLQRQSLVGLGSHDACSSSIEYIYFCILTASRAACNALSRLLKPAMKPLAWQKIPPGTPLTLSKAESRRPRHEEGKGKRDSNEPGRIETA